MTAVRMDLTTLFDAISARDERTVAVEIAKGLKDEIAPSKIAGRLAIAAALGDTTGTAVPVLVAAGRLGDWIRVIAPGPEPGAEQRQMLLPALPLVTAALFASSAIATGLKNQQLTLPDPLFPKDVKHAEGSWGALRDAVTSGDTHLAGQVLMGFYGSGTDYREMEGALYYALNAKFAADGKPLLALTKATQQLDFVEWGDRVPVLFQWLLPHLATRGAEPPGATEVRAKLGDPSKTLDFVRTRLQLSTPEAAGPALRQRVKNGSTADLLQAQLDALHGGATPPQVALQVCLVAAEHLAGIPLDQPTLLDAGVVALRVANSARLAVTHVQDTRILPIIFQAANLVNQTIRAAGGQYVQPTAATTSSPLMGGLIEYGILRNIERQLAAHDEAGARATIQRYTQMAYAGRSLAGTLGLYAARTAIADDANGRTLLVVQAAGEDYLAISQAPRTADGKAFMEAAIHAISAQQGDQTMAQRIAQLTGTALAPSPSA